MMIRVTYVVDLDMTAHQQPIQRNDVEEAFFSYMMGNTSYNDREVSLTWEELDGRSDQR